MENLKKFVGDVEKQISALMSDHSKPEPTTEQLHTYTSKVVTNLNSICVNAPQPVKDKVESAFGNRWNVKTNSPGSEPLTAMSLRAIFNFLTMEFEKQPRIQAAPEPPEVKKTFTGSTVTETRELPDDSYIGRVVGKKGATLRDIENVSECKLQISGTMVSVTGAEDGVAIALQTIDDIVSKGFSQHIMGDDFCEATMRVLGDRIPDIIGVAGSNIIKIKDHCKVEINIPSQGARGKDGKGKGKGQKEQNQGPVKKIPILIGGPKKGVEEAKEILNDILDVHHHPVTHPDQIHIEIEVKANHYSFLIGKKGSEIRHMQNSFHVRIIIPRDDSTHTGVIIVGEEKNVERCKAYIENLIWKVENKPQRGEDYGGAEYVDEQGTEESWAKSYLIPSRA